MSNPNFQSKLANTIVNRRLALFVLSLIILVVSSLGMPKLGFDPSIRALFQKDESKYAALEAIETKYLPNDDLALYVHSEGGLINSEMLNLIETLTGKAEQLPYSYRVNSVTNYQHTYAEGDTLNVKAVWESATSQSSDINRVSDIVLNSMVLRHRLISAAGDTSVIYITFNLPEDNRLGAITEIRESVNQLIENYSQHADIYLGGSVMVEATMLETTAKDGLYIVPLMLLFGMLINLFLLRSPLAYLSTFMVINLSVVATAGICGWLGIELTTTAAMGFLLVIVLATADSVHVSYSYLNQLRNGVKFDYALKKSIESNLKPIVLTSVTTCIGFLSLNFGDAKQFALMGNVAAIGVLFALFFTLASYPLLILIVRKTPKQSELLITRVTSWAVRTSLANSRMVILITGVSVVVFGYLATTNKFNDDPTEYFTQNTDIKKTVDFAIESMPNIKRIYFDLPSGQEQGIHEVGYLSQVSEFVAWLRQQEDVVHVFSYIDLIKQINKNLHGDDPAAYELPGSRELASQYLLLYEMSLPYGMDLQDNISLARDSLRIEIGIRNLDNQQLLALDQKAHNWLAENTSLENIKSSSIDLIFAKYGQTVLKSILIGSIMAIIMVTIVIIIGLRSLKYGLISLIPNLLPAVIVYGAWAIFNDTVTISAAITFAVSLGIIVDDTVFIFTKYLKERNRHATVDLALEAAYKASAPALIVTTLVFAVGAGLLVVSDFVPNAVIGYMMAPMIMVALVFDFLVLPAIVKFIDGKRVTGTLTESAVEENASPVEMA